MLLLIKEMKVLKGNTKGVLFISAFRISNFFTKNKILKILGFPIRMLYKIIFQWILGIDLVDTTKIGFLFNVFQ